MSQSRMSRAGARRSAVAAVAFGVMLGLTAGVTADSSAPDPRRMLLSVQKDVDLPVAEDDAGVDTDVDTDTDTEPITVRASPAPMAPPRPPAEGTIVSDPTTGRQEIVMAGISRTAVLIGDSQASTPTSWLQVALGNLGYQVAFSGAAGTGYVARNEEVSAPSYLEALTTGVWTLPHGNPALVVVEGGGNDAAQGTSDGEILSAAEALILELRRTYPTSRFVMVGTLSRSAADGGGRRNEVDALLGGLAEALGIPFVSTGSWLTEHHLEDQLADSVHLTPEGDARASIVLEQTLKALKLDVSYTTGETREGTGDLGVSE